MVWKELVYSMGTVESEEDGELACKESNVEVTVSLDEVI
jgi:hypothetical protein